MKSVPLRRRLLLLVAAGLLPLALISAGALLYLYQQNRSQAERSVLEVSRALSTAVQGEVMRTADALLVLSNSLHLDESDLSRFWEHARRAHDAQKHWLAVILFDAQGHQLMNTQFAQGAELPKVVESESLRETIESRQTRVGYLAKGPTGKWGIPVRVPILRGNQVKWVLTGVIDPAAILEVLERTRVPGDWVIAVSDAHGARVARTASPEQSLGTPFSPTLVEMMRKGGREGTGVTNNSEGVPVFTAYTRNPITGWVTAVGLPVAGVEINAQRSFLTFGSGIVLSIVLGILGALYLGRSVSEPMAVLRERALKGGEGRPLAMPETDVREIQDVANALVTAEVERSRAEADREELFRREQAARAAAEGANRAKDEFLAMLGHELRNPLGAISNATALLQQGGLVESQREQARAVIGRQVAHLSRLTDDLLDAGRAVTGKIVLQRRPVDLAEVARQALATLQSSGRTKRHLIEADLHAAWVEADSIRLDQIIANLVINAVKYSPPGSRIAVSVHHESPDAVLRVKDQGIGIPPELAPRVFDLFVQGTRELDRSLGGLGIGLTLVRRLAEMHGGTATVYSAGEDQGSEFMVRLPSIDPPAERAAPSARGAARSKGREILIVEDNADARETLQMLLEMMGHKVHVASDGETGVAAAERYKPEIMLVDIGLPRMDGYEVARRIRSVNGWPSRPLLIAVTGYGQDSDRQRAVAAGFDLHMAKPIEPNQLMEVIDGKVAADL